MRLHQFHSRWYGQISCEREKSHNEAGNQRAGRGYSCSFIPACLENCKVLGGPLHSLWRAMPPMTSCYALPIKYSATFQFATLETKLLTQETLEDTLKPYPNHRTFLSTSEYWCNTDSVFIEYFQSHCRKTSGQSSISYNPFKALLSLLLLLKGSGPSLR